MLQVPYEFPPICKHWTAPEWLGLGPFSSALPQPQKGEAPKNVWTPRLVKPKERSFIEKIHILSSPCLMMLILSTWTSTWSTDQRQDFNHPNTHKCNYITDWKRRFWRCCFKSIKGYPRRSDRWSKKNLRQVEWIPLMVVSMERLIYGQPPHP